MCVCEVKLGVRICCFSKNNTDSHLSLCTRGHLLFRADPSLSNIRVSVEPEVPGSLNDCTSRECQV